MSISPEPATTDPVAESDGQRYAALTDRAIAFIIERGGSAHEDLLIGHVFGNSGSLALWRPLLRSVLSGDQRVIFRADGQWAIPSQAMSDNAAGVLLDEFVAVDVETTGLRPLNQRVIEIALYRYKNGQMNERYETLVNPGRRIPAFISNLTGITDTHVAEAPPFAEIAERVQEFIGDALIVGHNVRFDIGFINAELNRVDRPALINECIDTMRLAVKLLRQLRKPSLDRVATAVGLTPRKIHRAGRDAELTAEVALRLVNEAVQQGVTSLDQLKVASALIEQRPRDDVGRGRAVMDRSLLADVPKKPGVYIMRDQFGHVIYVGKAKNLRDRVGSYYSQPLGYTRKMDGLLESMVKIDTEVVGSELEALVLESQLIRRYEPRYNTAMRRFEQYPYIRVDISNPWPKVSIARARKDDGAVYFGPYRNARGARRTVDVLNSVLPLRTCTRSFKNARSYGKPCIQLDLGKCLGPCVGQTVRDEYQQIVRDVVEFLGGRDEVLYERLWGELEASAERQDYERASRLRGDLRSVLLIVADQRRLHDAERLHNLIFVLPSADPACREVFLVFRGRVWAQIRATRVPEQEISPPTSPEGAGITDTVLATEPVDGLKIPTGALPGDATVATSAQAVVELAERLLRAAKRYQSARELPLDHHMVDEAAIVNRWLFRHADHPAILPLDPDVLTNMGEWTRLAHGALSLSDEALVFNERPGSEDEVIVADGDASVIEAGTFGSGSL